MVTVNKNSFITAQQIISVDNLKSKPQHITTHAQARAVQTTERLNEPRVKQRLKALLQKNISRHGGLTKMSCNALVATFNNHQYFHSGKAELAYNKLNNVIKNVNASMTKVESHHLNHFVPGTRKYQAAMEDLKHAVDAQYALEQALREYGSTVNGEASNFYASRADDCARRISEMLNCVSQAHAPQHLRNNRDISKKLAQSMDEVTQNMHGNSQVLQQIYKSASTLFSELDYLEQNPGEENTAKISFKNLEKDILRLQSQLSALFSYEDPDTKFRIVHDDLLYQSFSHSLTSALNRCRAIASPNITPVLENAIKELFKPTIDSLMDLYRENSNFPPEVIENIEKIIDYTQRTESHLLSKAALRGGLNDLTSLYEKQNRMRDYIIGWLNDVYENTDDQTYSDIWYAIDDSLYKPAGDEVFSAGLNELSKISKNTQTGQFSDPGNYLVKAFNDSPGIDALTECYVRGIPPQYIEKDTSPERLLQHKTLGAGAANEVTLCVYKAPHGKKPTEKVFKPEYPGRFGLTDLYAHAMDGNKFTDILVRNIASSEAANYLGCKNIVTSATAGVHEGQFGLFMNRALGRAPYNLIYPNQINCEKSPLDEVISTLVQHGNLNIAKANLQCKLSNLEWCDLLSGQVDRHPSNYLVDINPMTGDVEVTGIDNDTSFGTALTGVGMLSVNNLNISDDKFIELEPYFVRNYRGQLYLDKNKSPIIDMNTLNMDGLGVLRKTLGLNQKITPSFIDYKTYDALMQININEYSNTLMKLLPEENVQAAVNRLKAAREYAYDLFLKNRVISDWQAPGVEKEHNRTLSNYERNVDLGIVSPALRGILLPFYLRDFHDIFASPEI